MEKNLPVEILIEISLWLPAKSLLMLKTTCKLWHSIISSQSFVEKHTQNQMITYYGNHYDITRKDDMLKTLTRACTTTWRRLQRKFVACYHHRVIDDDMRASNCLVIAGGLGYSYEPGEFNFFVLKDYGNNKFQTSLKFKKEHLVINYPSPKQWYGSRMIGSCNGLICIYKEVGEIAIWNPTTGDLKIIPPSQSQLQERHVIGYEVGGKSGDVGFGFNSCTNDYKVIQLIFRKALYSSSLVYHRMEIYSLKTNSWRLYDHSTIPARINYHFENGNGSMVHKNEMFCWPALSETIHGFNPKSVILWFDMRDEVFRTTPFPEHLISRDVKMLPLHHSITLVCNSWDNRRRFGLPFCRGASDRSIEIWSIKDLQDKESWTKLFEITGLHPKRGICALGFWNNGQFMILKDNSDKLLLYNFRQRKVVKTGIREDYHSFAHLSSCIETLVAVNGYSSV